MDMGLTTGILKVELKVAKNIPNTIATIFTGVLSYN